MDLTQIRYFLALAETLNFTRAAEQCNVTQPALTRSIQRLEDELGGPLLLRERSLTQLTELGRTMLPLLERTYAAAEAVRNAADTLRRQDRAVLRIGLCSLVSIAVLLPLIQELSRRFPTLELTVSHGSTARLTEMLLQGELDSALLPEPELDAERLNRWKLFEERLVVLVPPGHRLASLDMVPLSALQDEPVLVHTDEQCALRQALLRLCQGEQLTLQLRHRASSGDSILQLVGAGLGIAVAASGQPAPPSVVRRPILTEPADALCARIMLVTVAGRPVGRAADTFVKLARARAWDMQRAAA